MCLFLPLYDMRQCASWFCDYSVHAEREGRAISSTGRKKIILAALTGKHIGFSTCFCVRKMKRYTLLTMGLTFKFARTELYGAFLQRCQNYYYYFPFGVFQKLKFCKEIVFSAILHSHTNKKFILDFKIGDKIVRFYFLYFDII